MEETRTGAHNVPADRRASQLELQLEQVQLTLEQLRQTHGSLHDMESRLGDMTRDCAEILERWARNDEKHAAAVVELHGRLSEWNDVERRLLTESATRVHQFERSLQHEWNALKARHEAPLQQLEAQSTRIAETCIVAVEQALKGFEKAEQRLAMLEANVQHEMAQLASEVRTALSDLRDQQALGAARQPWSLDNVVRLHNEIRTDEQGLSAPPPALPASSTSTATLGLATAALRAARPIEAPRPEAVAIQPTPHETLTDEEPDARPARSWWPVGALLLILLVGGAYGVYLHNRLSTGLEDAASRAAAAERQAAGARVEAQQQIEQVRQAADRRLASAEHAAATAQWLGAILAAPDVRRFELTGGPDAPPVQLLWSRTRGIAASAASLPALPEGRVYQVWFVTRAAPASVGVLPPSPSQAVSAAFPWPADLQRMVVGAMVTVEPAGGSTAPTAAPWLTSRAPAPPPGTANPSNGS